MPWRGIVDSAEFCIRPCMMAGAVREPPPLHRPAAAVILSPRFVILSPFATLRVNSAKDLGLPLRVTARGVGIKNQLRVAGGLFTWQSGLMKRIVIITVGLVALLYAGDYLSVRLRIPRSRDPYGVVRVRSYYVVPQKNRKPEFYFIEPQDQVCVRSLFPHLGYKPCWYLRRRSQNRIEM